MPRTTVRRRLREKLNVFCLLWHPKFLVGLRGHPARWRAAEESRLATTTPYRLSPMSGTTDSSINPASKCRAFFVIASIMIPSRELSSQRYRSDNRWDFLWAKTTEKIEQIFCAFIAQKNLCDYRWDIAFVYQDLCLDTLSEWWSSGRATSLDLKKHKTALSYEICYTYCVSSQYDESPIVKLWCLSTIEYHLHQI